MERVRLPTLSSEDRDQIIVMRDVPWESYEALLDARGAAPRPKLAYLDGELEIMTTSMRHEIGKKLLARLVEMWAIERDVSLNGAGETTFRKRAKSVGLEPDECYFVGKIKKAPDLAIEIVHASGGVDKLEIYRRLGVKEVWFWIRDRIWIYWLSGKHYHQASASAVLQDIDVAQLEQIVATTEDDEQTEAVRAYRDALRSSRSKRRRT
jgi:Uma2 family endonuclease